MPINRLHTEVCTLHVNSPSDGQVIAISVQVNVCSDVHTQTNHLSVYFPEHILVIMCGMGLHSVLLWKLETVLIFLSLAGNLDFGLQIW